MTQKSIPVRVRARYDSGPTFLSKISIKAETMLEAESKAREIAMGWPHVVSVEILRLDQSVSDGKKSPASKKKPRPSMRTGKIRKMKL